MRRIGNRDQDFNVCEEPLRIWTPAPVRSSVVKSLRYFRSVEREVVLVLAIRSGWLIRGRRGRGVPAYPQQQLAALDALHKAAPVE